MVYLFVAGRNLFRAQRKEPQTHHYTYPGLEEAYLGVDAPIPVSRADSSGMIEVVARREMLVCHAVGYVSGLGADSRPPFLY